MKLIATGRSSSYFVKPTEQDEALRNFILFAGTGSLALTLLIAVLISFLGTVLDIDDVSFAVLASFVPFVYLLLASLFLADARRFILPLIYVPSLLYTLLVARAAVRNSQASEPAPPEPDNQI